MSSTSTVLEYPQRHAVSAAEYLRMGEAGVFEPDTRLELIEGEIVEMAPIGDRHVACVMELGEALIACLIGRAKVIIQSPVRLSSSAEPEPDLAVLRLRDDRYRTGLPRAEDVLLIIEVSDTTLAYDRGIKLRLYALADIPEVWIWDLKRRRALVSREPDGATYRDATVVERGTLAPLALPDCVIALEEILG